MGLQHLARLSWREGQADLLGSTAHPVVFALTHACPGCRWPGSPLKAGRGHGLQRVLEVGGGYLMSGGHFLFTSCKKAHFKKSLQRHYV